MNDLDIEADSQRVVGQELINRHGVLFSLDDGKLRRNNAVEQDAPKLRELGIGDKLLDALGEGLFTLPCKSPEVICLVPQEHKRSAFDAEGHSTNPDGLFLAQPFGEFFCCDRFHISTPSLDWKRSQQKNTPNG